jgi:hypothetical protein
MMHGRTDKRTGTGGAIDAAPRRAADPTESGAIPEVRLWIPSGSEVPPATRNDPPQARARWLSRQRLLALTGALAVLLIGAGALYSRTNNGFVKTDNTQTNIEFMPITPRLSGTVARVFVDARLGTVLIDFSTMAPDTSRPVSSAAQERRGHLRNQVGAVSGTRGMCAPEPSASIALATHVAPSGICAFGRGAACPFGRRRPSDLSR